MMNVKRAAMLDFSDTTPLAGMVVTLSRLASLLAPVRAVIRFIAALPSRGIFAGFSVLFAPFVKASARTEVAGSGAVLVVELEEFLPAFVARNQDRRLSALIHSKIVDRIVNGRTLSRAVFARVFSVIPKLLAALRAACPGIRRVNPTFKRAMGFGLVDELLAACRTDFTMNRFRVMGATNRAILSISRHGSSYCEGLPALSTGQGNNPVGVLTIPTTEVPFEQLVLAFRLPKSLTAVIAGNIYKVHCCLSLIRDLDFHEIGRPGIKEPGFSGRFMRPSLATCILTHNGEKDYGWF